MTIYSLMGIRRKAKIRQILEIWKAVQLNISQQRTGSRKILSSGARHRQALALKLRKNRYSDTQIEIAKTLSAGGLTDEQVLQRLEELKNTGIC